MVPLDGGETSAISPSRPSTSHTQGKYLNPLAWDGQETELQIFCEPEANVSHFKRPACMSCLCPSHRPQRMGSQSFLPEFNCPGLIFVTFSKHVFSPFACDLASLQVLVSYAVGTNVDEYLCGENFGFFSGKICQDKEYGLALEMQQ